MKILMLVNWKVEYTDHVPTSKQPPDYYVEGDSYWFYRYFTEPTHVDVIDTHSFPWLEKFEKNKIRFYIFQTLKAIPRLGRYDLIVSHGVQSGVVLSLWRRLFRTKAKHIVFEIGSFNSAAEDGWALKMMQFASKSIDGVIYHTGSQKEYYQRFFPWIVKKSRWIRFGTDLDYFEKEQNSGECSDESILSDIRTMGDYLLCVGSSKRDWCTLIEAYAKLHRPVNLVLIGHVNPAYRNLEGVKMIPSVPIRELMEWIKGALFCVLPLQSFNYSYGQMTLMQQMALEKCVVTAEVPSLADYVIDGKTAVTYAPEDAEELARCIDRLLRQPDICSQIGRNAREWLLVHCNEKKMASEIETFYREVLGE